MHTGPYPFQPVQRVGLQRRHNGSQRREVFAYSTLLLGENKSSQNVAHFPGRFIDEFVCVPADLSDVYPALDDPRSDMWSDLSVFQHCADHTGRHSVKLRNGGANGGGAVLVVLLVPLRPDGAQAVVGYHLFKQQLEKEKQADISMTTVKKHGSGCNLRHLFPATQHSRCQFTRFHLISLHLPRPCRSAAPPPGRPQTSQSPPGPRSPLPRLPPGRKNCCRGNQLKAGNFIFKMKIEIVQRTMSEKRKNICCSTTFLYYYFVFFFLCLGF